MDELGTGWSEAYSSGVGLLALFKKPEDPVSTLLRRVGPTYLHEFPLCLSTMSPEDLHKSSRGKHAWLAPN